MVVVREAIGPVTGNFRTRAAARTCAQNPAAARHEALPNRRLVTFLFIARRRREGGYNRQPEAPTGSGRGPPDAPGRTGRTPSAVVP